ncbi:MAG: DUF4209 domain-containing protein [Candidatus Cloacimonetes bacterium]|nr:DUF4209 domain-containing protein [Candidatus Cloacimonadota bacterium]MDY0366770.1 DUF4209 domain-containing protein [Candidatus Syntrophosphaera sp.]
MIQYRYDEKLDVHLEDYINAGVDAIIERLHEKDISSFHEHFSNAAKECIDNGKLKEGKVLWLLADASSMMLVPESPNEPYKPFCSMGGRRSALPEDFLLTDITFFQEIVSKISDYRLRSRIADICWYIVHPRNPDYALIAIDAYLNYRFEENEHYFECENPYKRAIYLCHIHRDLTRDRVTKIHDYLIETLRNNVKNHRIVDIVSDLLIRNGLGSSTDIVIEILLESSHTTKLDSERTLLDRAFDLIAKKNYNDPRLFEIKCRIAESYVEQGTSATSSMFAAEYYHLAIEAYRKIPRKIRIQYVSEDRIKELYEMIEGANKQATTEMNLITSPTMNVTEILTAVEGHVKGHNLPDAIYAFVSLIEQQKEQEYSEKAIERMKDSILSALVSKTHYSRDGRVVCKTSGISLNDPDGPQNKKALWVQMLEDFAHNISFSVSVMILPALKILNAEHLISLSTMIDLCSLSIAVPKDRMLLWAKGIYCGFESDFLTAVHLLTPQVENYVRISMKRNGIKTTFTDENGIETEKSLSKLLEDKDISQVLDNDLLFETKAVFTDPVGFNMRNEIAHGLVDSYVGFTYSSVYTWYFCLRLVLSNIRQQQTLNQD